MHFKQELKIVRIKEDLGKGKYLTEDAFNEEKIIVKLSGKLRMHYVQIPIETFIYAIVTNLDTENARYIHTWKNTASLTNEETLLDKQREILDSQFIELYGIDEFRTLPS